MFSLHFALVIENSFPDRITRMSFYQKYYQLLLHGKFPMKEKKLLVVGPPDSGKTSWFAPFQGILTNTDLLLSNENVAAIICSGILFTKNLYHIEANQFILVFRFCNILLKVILEQTLDQDQVLNNAVSSFETVVITSILQMMDHLEN